MRVRGARRLGRLARRAGIPRPRGRLDALQRSKEQEREEQRDEARRAFDETLQELDRIGRNANRIVCGPWHSEVGFEVLYWIPMLRQFQRRYGLKPKHMTVISRGGAAPWYRQVTSDYVEIFDHFSPEEFRELQERRVTNEGSEKQVSLGELDREILERTRASVKKDAVLLHPSLMYRLFLGVWKRRLPISLWQRETSYEPLRASGAEHHHVDLNSLPSEYVAVKLYFSDCFPDTAENRRVAGRLVERLAQHTEVVMLTTGMRLDHHEDFAARLRSNVHDLSESMRPTTNLALQTDVIRGASAFFSTYGGFSYVGPLLGVPTVSLYSVDNFNPTHLDVMRRMVQAQGSRLGADFTVIGTQQLDLLELLVGAKTGEVREAR